MKNERKKFIVYGSTLSGLIAGLLIIFALAPALNGFLSSAVLWTYYISAGIGLFAHAAMQEETAKDLAIKYGLMGFGVPVAISLMMRGAALYA